MTNQTGAHTTHFNIPDERSVAICLRRDARHASKQIDAVRSIGLIGRARSEPAGKAMEQRSSRVR